MEIDYRKELNKSQYEAVTTTEGPVLILAGAGTGKTRCMVYRVAYLIEKGVSPNNILLLTFTNKAANEMKQRAADMLDERCSQITACTYHSFCAKMLRKYSQLIGIQSDYTIIDPGDCADIISIIETEHGMDKVKDFPRSSQLVSAHSKALNTNQSLEDTLFDMLGKWKYMEIERFIPDIKKILADYQSYKKQNNMMDYDDLLINFISVLKRNPSIKNKLADIYQYIMIDEYQDSNYLQEKIIFMLREKNRNLAVVGDDYQCIYGFRGSMVENIINFPQKMSGCKVVYLTQNYRSNQEIMDLSNIVMKKHSLEGFFKKLVATHVANIQPLLVRSEDEGEEASYILNKIMALHDEEEIPYHEICVLERSSYHSVRLEALLNKMKIPYDKYGGMKFFDYDHIKNFLCFLRCQINPHDEIAWFRLLKLFDGIGNVYARNIAATCKTLGLEGLVQHKYIKRKFQPDLENLKSFIEKLNDQDFQIELQSIKSFYSRLMNITLMLMKTSEKKRRELARANKQAVRDFDTLIEMADGYDSPVTFLEEIMLEASPQKEEEEDRMVISTIHSAKGLEFHSVFVMNCVDTMFPSTDKDQIGTVEDNEELRCFYVAITRAKERLFLMAPKYIAKFGCVEEGIISHFISDVFQVKE